MKKLALVVLFVLGLFMVYSTNNVDTQDSESVEQNRIAVQQSVHDKHVHNAVINGGER